MSVKFKETTVRAVSTSKEDLAHKVGDHLTGGKTGAGYLAVCDRCPVHCMLQRWLNAL
jgi:hypothetical protein